MRQPEVAAWIAVVQDAIAAWYPDAPLMPDEESASVSVELLDRHGVKIDRDFHIHFRTSEVFSNQVVLDVVWQVYQPGPEISQELAADLLRLHAFDGSFFALLPFGDSQGEAVACIARVPWESLTRDALIGVLDDQCPRVVAAFELCEAVEERYELGAGSPW